MTTRPPFDSFPSIPRLKRDCVISEKIDGTNATIWISDDGSEIAAASRNKWISPEADNMGFAKWVAANSEELKKLGPGWHRGEWWGQGIQCGYGLKEKRFSLFNSDKWTDDVRPACCGVVPVLYRGVFTMEAVADALTRLETGGSVAAPGFMKPEGVVIFHVAASKYFKVTLGGDGHKSVSK